MGTSEGPRLMALEAQTFNHSLAFFLPKSSSGLTEDGLPAFRTSATRPLMVTNTDNRIIAQAVRLALEPRIEHLIVDCQRGFLPGRSLLENVLDVEQDMVRRAAASPSAGAFFFDFEAAFPSLSQAAIHAFVQSLGWPDWLRRFLECLYTDNECEICLMGGRFSGFAIQSGIRQGCPLSPLIFALFSDLFLRRLQREDPVCLLRAWADDLALITDSAVTSLPQLERFFHELHLTTGLKLNISKTYLLPLVPSPPEDFRPLIFAHAPSWAGIQLTAAARYLGVYVGPQKGDLAWKGPVAKFQQRAQLWGRLGLGMTGTLHAFRVYVASVLLFVAQVQPLPSQYDNIERKALQALFPGPRGWITASCLRDLKALGNSTALLDVPATALAAKVRVARFEAQGRLAILQRTADLTTWLSRYTGGTLAHMHWLHTWASQCFARHIQQAVGALDLVMRTSPTKGPPLREGPGWQMRCAGWLTTSSSGEAAWTHLRRRLDRWALMTLPGHRLAIATRNLYWLWRHGPARLGANFLRTLCNGWCTGRRFQLTCACRFGCGATEDSIEHYARCVTIRRLWRDHGVPLPPPSPAALDYFLGFRPCDTSTEATVLLSSSAGEPSSRFLRYAGCLYATARLLNCRRYSSISAGHLDGAFLAFLHRAWESPLGPL